MERITSSLSLKDQKPVRSIRVGGSHGETFALFCFDDKVIVTDKRDFDKIYMVCDADLFVRMVGLKFIVRPVKRRKINRKGQVK